MISKSAPSVVAVLVTLVPVLAVAQDRPKVEAFGGYSTLGLRWEPNLRFDSALLNGWKASLKLNLTPRIGLLGDFSGHYGQLGFTPYRLSPLSASWRQHTYMVGLETRIVTTSRVGFNARALMGVAQMNHTVPPLYIPVISPSAFTVAFGASLDYRITDRLSYRIIEPELLTSRIGSLPAEHWQRFNVRLSTGIVFTSGRLSSSGTARRRFSFGAVGGVALTDAFDHESRGVMPLPGGGTEATRFRSFSTRKDYLIGPTVDLDLPWRGMSVEVGALYRLMSLTMAGVRADGSLHSISPATVVTWQFPILAKYRFGRGSVKPFIEAGPSFRSSGNLNASSPSPFGVTAGSGVEMSFLGLRIAPRLRYTHWAADPDHTASRSKRNQLEALIGVYF
jgi:hypothetical protein